MRTKVLLYEVNQSDDGYGGKTYGTDTVKRTFWAKKRETSSSRIDELGQTVLNTGIVLNAYNNKSASVVNGNLIGIDGSTYTVTGVVKKFDNREIEITATLRSE